MNSTYLRRYMDLPALVYMLKERKITLLDPRSWDDSNDSYYMGLYKQRKKLKSLLAACFTETAETYHHWRVFAGGTSGVCVRFLRRRILKNLSSHSHLRGGAVKYLAISDLRKRKLSIQELPFRKRQAFEDECEYRIIFESHKNKKATLDISVPLTCIDRVTLSPWIHPSLYTRLKKTLRSIEGCSDLRIVRSTLVGSEDWKKFGDAAKA